jgi:hypothetical protein
MPSGITKPADCGAQLQLRTNRRRLALTESAYVRNALNTPYRDGTTHVNFESEDFNARLAALVLKPCAHLTRYHGIFAPASPERRGSFSAQRTLPAGCRCLGSGHTHRSNCVELRQRIAQVVAQ